MLARIILNLCLHLSGEISVGIIGVGWLDSKSLRGPPKIIVERIESVIDPLEAAQPSALQHIFFLGGRLCLNHEPRRACLLFFLLLILDLEVSFQELVEFLSCIHKVGVDFFEVVVIHFGLVALFTRPAYFGGRRPPQLHLLVAEPLWWVRSTDW